MAPTHVSVLLHARTHAHTHRFMHAHRYTHRHSNDYPIKDLCAIFEALGGV